VAKRATGARSTPAELNDLRTLDLGSKQWSANSGTGFRPPTRNFGMPRFLPLRDYTHNALMSSGIGIDFSL
jgi:hypothetical protein